MKIVPFAEIETSIWESTADLSGESWLFHRAGWIIIESGFWALENRSFAILDDHGKCIGICPLYRRDLARGWVEKILDTGEHRHTGPAFVDGLQPDVIKSAVKITMQHILDEGYKLDIDRIVMNAHNLAPANFQGRTEKSLFGFENMDFKWGLYVGPNGSMGVPGITKP